MNLIDTLSESFNSAMASFIDALPTVIGALLILLVGWIVGRLVGSAVTSILTRVGADQRFSQYAGAVYGPTAGAMAPSRLVGLLARWFIYLVFFIAAANFLGWPQVSSLLNSFVAWLPNLVAAVVILIAAPVIGQVLRTTIESSSQGMGLGGASIVGRLAQWGVILFGVLAALAQVGIADTLVTTLFTGIVAAIAIALGISFGLGGRDVASEVVRAVYESRKSVPAGGGMSGGASGGGAAGGGAAPAGGSTKPAM